MAMKLGMLELARPLCAVDCETTGTNASMDRIVEVAAVRVGDGGDVLNPLVLRQLVRPGIPIPAEATAVHHITDEMVARDGLPFADPRVGHALARLLEGADILGFGVLHFDMELLDAEFKRADIPFDKRAHQVVDAMAIFHRREPRDLGAAVRFYLGREHEGAHGAMADCRAALDVLLAQLVRYPDLPAAVAGLDEYCRNRDPSWVDAEGKIAFKNGEACLTFGKHRGRSLRDLAATTDYLRWMLDQDFATETKRIVQSALRGVFPKQDKS